MKLFKSLLLALALSLPLFAAAGEPVNINTADAVSIAASLNGIGEAKARACEPRHAERVPTARRV